MTGGVVKDSINDSREAKTGGVAHLLAVTHNS
jgi:hypothetical protein